MAELAGLSFGAPAAIVTSMGLIVGLGTVTAAKATIVASLLVTGIADSLTDSVSVHIYRESERLAERRAFRTTVANFIARPIVSRSFILLSLSLATSTAIIICAMWGFNLLSGLSLLLVKVRRVSAFSEIVEHVSVGFVVIAISKAVGLGIQHMAGSA